MNKISKKINNQSGMTYIELIVVIAIFSIMSGIALVNNRSFNDQVVVTNFAQDIALQVVNQQKSAVFGKLPDISQQPYINTVMSNLGLTSWKPAYGAYFDSTPGSNNRFILFTDATQDNFYSGNNCVVTNDFSVDECSDLINFTGGVKILYICTEMPGDPPCFDLTTNNLVADAGSASVVFTRPNSNAVIFTDGAQFDGSIRVVISNQDESVKKSIVISSSGKIAVE